MPAKKINYSVNAMVQKTGRLLSFSSGMADNALRLGPHMRISCSQNVST